MTGCPTVLGIGGRQLVRTAGRQLVRTAVCAALVAASFSCSGKTDDSGWDERVRLLERVQLLETETQALKTSLAALASENAVLRQTQSDFAKTLETLETTWWLEKDDVSKADSLLPIEKEWPKDDDEDAENLHDGNDKNSNDKNDNAESASTGNSATERTAELVKASGGEISYVDHPERSDRSVLVLPTEFVDGRTPLIVSLHGYGGDSAYQSAYVPLHERVNTDGFALLLPNASPDVRDNRSWNPTDRCCDGGKNGDDDIAYLTDLVAEAKSVRDFGPVYFFGYSNGGFMAYHMACKGLPGLRAVASLAGTSYVEDSSCDNAPPVSVLHVHGTADDVILFKGDVSEEETESGSERAFYAGAEDMVTRWSLRAGCEWTGHDRPYADLDLDQAVPGFETQVYRQESGCVEGIDIQLWKGVGSGHTPIYGDAFTDALLDWLLSQR